MTAAERRSAALLAAPMFLICAAFTEIAEAREAPTVPTCTMKAGPPPHQTQVVKDCAFPAPLTRIPEGSWEFERVSFDAISLPGRTRIGSLRFTDCVFHGPVALPFVHVDGDLVFRSTGSSPERAEDEYVTRDDRDEHKRSSAQCPERIPMESACLKEPLTTRFERGIDLRGAEIAGDFSLYLVEVVPARRVSSPDACRTDISAGEDAACGDGEINLTRMTIKGITTISRSDFGLRVNLEHTHTGILVGLCTRFREYARTFELISDGIIELSGTVFDKDVNMLRMKSASTLALDRVSFNGTDTRRSDVHYFPETTGSPSHNEEWFADVEMFGVAASDIRMQKAEVRGSINLSGLVTGVINVDIDRFHGRVNIEAPAFGAIDARRCKSHDIETAIAFLNKADYSRGAYDRLEESVKKDKASSSKVFLAAKYRELGAEPSGPTWFVRHAIWLIGYGRRDLSGYVAVFACLIFLRSRIGAVARRRQRLVESGVYNLRLLLRHPIATEVRNLVVIMASVLILSLTSASLGWRISLAVLAVGMWDAPDEIIQAIRLRKVDLADADGAPKPWASFLGYVYVLLFAGSAALVLLALKSSFE